MSKSKAVFLLGLENLLTMAILVVWIAGYTDREQESSLILDKVMLVYNFSKIGYMLYELVAD